MSNRFNQIHHLVRRSFSNLGRRSRFDVLDDSIGVSIVFFSLFPVAYLSSNLFLNFIRPLPILSLNVIFVVVVAVGTSALSAWLQKHFGKTVCRLYVATSIALAATMQIWLPYYNEWLPAYIIAFLDQTCRQSVEPVCLVEWVAIKPDLWCCTAVTVVRAHHGETYELNNALKRKGIHATAARSEAIYGLFFSYAVVIYTVG